MSSTSISSLTFKSPAKAFFTVYFCQVQEYLSVSLTSASKTILFLFGQITWSTWGRTFSQVKSFVLKLACKIKASYAIKINSDVSEKIGLQGADLNSKSIITLCYTTCKDDT